MIKIILLMAIALALAVSPALAEKKKTETSGGGLDELVGALGGGQKMSLEDSGSSHSIRGLSKAEGGKGATKPEAESSVKAMESYSVKDSDVKNFQKEGGLK